MSQEADARMAALGYAPRGQEAAKMENARAIQLDSMFSAVSSDKEEEVSEIKNILEGMTLKATLPTMLPDMKKSRSLPTTPEELKEQLKMGDGGGGRYETIDTGVELPPEVSATIIGFGDQVGDLGRGIKQLLTENGYVDKDHIWGIDAKVQDENEEIMRKLYDDPEYGVPAMGGAVAGAIAEPIGLLLPATKAKHLGKAFAYGATVGGLYGSGLYIDGDESRIKNAAIGAILGGGISSVVSRFARHAAGSKMDDLIKENKPVYRMAGKDPVTGKPKFRQVSRPEVAAENMAGLETKASMDGPRFKKLQEAREIVDLALQPIYDNIRKYAPKVAARARKMDADQHRTSRKWTQATKSFNDWFNSIPLEAQKAMHKELSRGITKEAIALANKLSGKSGVDSLTAVQRTLKEILGEYKGVGYKIQERGDYFPTSVRDLKQLTKVHQTEIDKILAKEAKRKGRPLTNNEKKHATERLLTFDVRFANTSGSLKKRTIENIRDDQLPAYHDPITALHYYISSAAEDISRRKFFKDFGYKPKAGDSLDVTGADIDKSIDSVADAIMREGATPDAQDKIVKLLRSRMGNNIHDTHQAVQAIKNLSYASTLGNYWSALTQLGDTVFAMHKYGINNTVRSMFGKNITTKEGMGIDKAMIELNAARSKTSKLADWAFKWGGFDKMDAFGKNVNLNSSLRQNRKLALKDPAAFKKKWGIMFGEETDNVIGDLKAMKMTKNESMSDNVHLMLWNDLADTQPIGLSEMPAKYLDMPNGRIIYAYKTFSLKQFNYMRNLINAERNPAKKAADLTYFASLFVIANAGIDSIKEFKTFMDGKDIRFGDKVWDNTLALVGTSKYGVDKSKGLGGWLDSIVAPVIYTQGKRALDATVGKGDLSTGDVINTLPVVGKINKELEIIK